MFSGKNLLFNQSKCGPQSIAIIGAGGKIGMRVLETVWKKPAKFANLARLVAINTEPKTILGFFFDESVANPKIRKGQRLLQSKTIMTNDASQLTDVDHIFITAGWWPTEAEKQAWATSEESGRLIQSFKNYPLIKKICIDIQTYAPNARVYVLTNQVDMMTAIARQALPSQMVVGIGGTIDTMRFKYLLAEKLSTISTTVSVDEIEAQIIGFHNNDMLLLESSLKVNGQAPLWTDDWRKMVDETLQATKNAGAIISRLQKHSNMQQIDSGSAVTPAKAITDIMQALLTEQPLVTALNIALEPTTASHYGVKAATALSLPVKIQSGLIDTKYASHFSVTHDEQTKLILAQQHLQQNMLLLHAKQADLNIDVNPPQSISLFKICADKPVTFVEANNRRL